MKTLLLRYAKAYFRPIFYWALTEAAKRRFNPEEIAEALRKNKKYLYKKMLDYNIKQAEKVKKYWDTGVTDRANEGVLTFGTYDDTEEFLWGQSTVQYTGQKLVKLPFFVQEYNQLWNKFKSTVLCFLYGFIGMFSDNLHIVYTRKELDNMDEKAVNSRNYSKSKGGYFSEWKRITNEETENKQEYITYELPSNSRYIKSILDSGHTITIGIRLTDKILSGIKDGILSISEIQGGIYKYNHLLRVKRSEDGKIDLWIDNYKGTLKFNTIQLEDFYTIADSGRLMRTAYFVTPTGKTLQRILEETGAEVDNNVDNGNFDSYQYAIDEGITNGKDPEKGLIRKEGAMMSARVHKDLNDKIIKLAKEVAKLKK